MQQNMKVEPPDFHNPNYPLKGFEIDSASLL